MRIEFSSDGVPPDVPQDVSLTVFRVLQESVQNAVKYSCAEHCQVQLRGLAGNLELTVRDNGVGFDVEKTLNDSGLGLISMRERISLANGTILVASRPMGGTEINVRVPVPVGSDENVTAGAA